MFKFGKEGSSQLQLNNVADNHEPINPLPAPEPGLFQAAPPIPEDVDKSDPLMVAIFYHDKNQLKLAAYFFSVAASKGSPLGLFLYAMCLRHGWGVTQDEKLAVKLLQRSAESAIGDLHAGGNGLQGLNTATLKSIATHELTLAIYELAISFKQGWGVPKSKTTAAYYLTVAAQLGDKDAQVELGECYLRGDGVKADKRMAAKWFREAEKQGAQMVSMQWIWKKKYDMD
ncbi:hypothetical protein HK102_005561 [Quaeritorhiza haematococci]|nr:hypothetical protein HK102_005561 [Quaeritorhiza haematococci]